MSEAAIKSAQSALKSNNYKALKEAFVSNLNGGTISEIVAVTMTMPTAVLVWSILQSRKHFFVPVSASNLLVDWLINCAAILFATTVYSRTPLVLNALLLLPALLTLFSQGPLTSTTRRLPKSPSTQSAQSSSAPTSALPMKPFVTMYRGSMMVITCAAILAVDFRVFPRRFAKVENWGTSLMDLGVGSFVFSAGVVAARTTLKVLSPGARQPSLLSRILSALRNSFSLLALGFIRLLTVKGVDYAEHVTEYGVHWNFFFTLGFLPPFAALFESVFAWIPSYKLLALIVASAYELALDCTDLTKYIVTAPRTDIISMNREGIFSFAGYLAIFLAGQDAGMNVLPREYPPSGQGISGKGPVMWVQSVRKSIQGRVLISGLTYTALYLVTSNYYGLNLHVSRRFANLPYVLWVCAFNSFNIAILVLIEKYLFPNLYSATKDASQAGIEEERRKCKAAASSVLQAFNRNGLAIFLFANLLTGAINLSMNTLDMNVGSSMAVLVSYMAILAFLAVGLDLADITVKF